MLTQDISAHTGKRDRTVAVVCVRMDSTRLPGKTLKEIGGKPLLQHIIERLRRSKELDDVVVATTTDSKDDAIESLCTRLSVPFFRGSEDDVSDRTYGALKSRDATTGVMVYGDGPFPDPEIIDEFVRFFREHEFDFVCNDITTTYPPGVEVEVFKVDALGDAVRKTTGLPIREHATLFIRQHPELYHIHNIEAPTDVRYPDVHIEVDTEEDLEVMTETYEALAPENPAFGTREILAFLTNHPEIANRNKAVPRRWSEFRQEI